LFPPNPPLDLCQNEINFSLEGVEGSPKILASSDLASGSYTGWKWRVLWWSPWKDFHDNASGFLFQLIVPLKSTVGFVSKLNQF